MEAFDPVVFDILTLIIKEKANDGIVTIRVLADNVCLRSQVLTVDSVLRWSVPVNLQWLECFDSVRGVGSRDSGIIIPAFEVEMPVDFHLSRGIVPRSHTVRAQAVYFDIHVLVLDDFVA